MADPNRYQGPGSGGTNVSDVNVVPYNVDNTGVADTAASQAAIWALIAVLSGQAAWYPIGTYKIATSINVISDLKLQARAGSTFQSTVTSIADFTRGPYRFFPPLAGKTGTLASTPSQGNPQTLSITRATKPAIGTFQRVEHGQTWAIYIVTASPSVASPWTVTVDRPIVFPFVSTDSVEELASIVQDVDLDFGRALLSGTGDFLIDLAGTFNCRIANVGVDTSLGTPGVEGITFDLGGSENEHYNVRADFGGASIGGLLLESQESSRGTNCRVSSIGAGGSGFEILNSYASGWADCWANACDTGFLVDLIGGGFPCFDCWISGGSAVVGAYGARIVNGTRTVVERWSAEGCTTAGLLVDNPAVSTRITDVSLTRCARGLRVNSGATDTVVKGLDVSGCTIDGVLVDNAGGGTPDVTITGLTAIGMPATALDLTAGTTRVYGMRATHTTGNALTSILCNAVRHEIIGAKIDMTGTTGSVGVLCEAGITYLENVAVNGANVGLQVLSGATVILGRNCDFSGSTNPIQLLAGGKILADQSGFLPVAVTNANVTLDSKQQLNRVLAARGVLTADVVIYIPQMVNHSIAGLEYDLSNETSGAHAVTFAGLGGGAGVTVAQGKRASGYMDDADNLQRDSPDT